MTEPAAAPPMIYVGFWPRFVATIIDSVIVLVITGPLLWAIYGRSMLTSGRIIQGPFDLLLTWIFPPLATILFWIYREATPGKMALDAHIVDARTGDHPSTRQLIGRYLGYFVATIPLGLGLLWVAWDPRKQGWHDKLAGTVVVRRPR
jgi:uncharacterized RDD family membrane protein YckC